MAWEALADDAGADFLALGRGLAANLLAVAFISGSERAARLEQPKVVDNGRVFSA